MAGQNCPYRGPRARPAARRSGQAGERAPGDALCDEGALVGQCRGEIRIALGLLLQHRVGVHAKGREQLRRPLLDDDSRCTQLLERQRPARGATGSASRRCWPGRPFRSARAGRAAAAPTCPCASGNRARPRAAASPACSRAARACRSRARHRWRASTSRRRPPCPAAVARRTRRAAAAPPWRRAGPRPRPRTCRSAASGP